MIYRELLCIDHLTAVSFFLLHYKTPGAVSSIAEHHKRIYKKQTAVLSLSGQSIGEQADPTANSSKFTCLETNSNARRQQSLLGKFNMTESTFWSSDMSSSLVDFLLNSFKAQQDKTTTLIQITCTLVAIVLLWLLHYVLFKPLNRIRVS